MKKWVLYLLFVAIILVLLAGYIGEFSLNGLAGLWTESTNNSPVETAQQRVQTQDPDDYEDRQDQQEQSEETDQEEVPELDLSGYVYSPFSNKPVADPGKRRAIMASVENTRAARPQSGLETAPIVYEVLAEGGVTRFLPLYWGELPEEIGPIRSLRPYMIEIGLEYGALLLHAGASPDGFSLLEEKKVIHLDQLYNGNYYWRSSQRNIPHNLYTGERKIEDYFQEITGREYDSRFQPRRISFISEDEVVADRIYINYWGDYRVIYEFDREQNHYQRFLNDLETPHRTPDGVQLTPENIIVQHVATEVKDDQGRLEMELTGEGKALVFRDGTVIRGRWSKQDQGPTKFYDNQERRIQLNPGQTWIQLVPESSLVTFEDSDLNEQTD